jgi:hypothetical protein
MLGFVRTHSTTSIVEDFPPQGWKPGPDISASAGSTAITTNTETAESARLTILPPTRLYERGRLA